MENKRQIGHRYAEKDGKYYEFLFMDDGPADENIDVYIREQDTEDEWKWLENYSKFREPGEDGDESIPRDIDYYIRNFQGYYD